MKKVYPEQGQRVFVGLSGGVDSAVSAALLQKEGYDVTGVFIKAWTPPGFVCNWKEDRRSAMRVAAVLDIPFITLDLEKEYKKEVVDYMIEEYKKGRTPNPDVMCNKEIKFGAFLNFALKNGADYVATGHYAQIENGILKEGEDKNKDQSYFLWTLTKDQLSHTLFPIGHLQKEEVRKLAEKFGLPQATRKDSQGLCFLGKIDMKEFLKEYIKTEKGEVLDRSGKVIGEHDGAFLYTIGERHGFRVFNDQTESEPMYVVRKDVEQNTITVAQKKNVSSEKSSGRSSGLNQTFSPENFSFGLTEINLNREISKQNKIECRFRYRQEKVPCNISGDRVTFKTAQTTVSPGQSVVFYDKEVCLGGGIIGEVIV